MLHVSGGKRGVARERDARLASFLLSLA